MQSKSAAMLAQQKLLNLKVLQKSDSGITEVLDIVGHITVYTFNQKNATWKVLIHVQDRKEVEGTMFLVKRASDPQYQFIVMNRLSTTNLVETITSNFVMQVSEPYLLYRNAHGEVNGIWFYDKDERERICSKIQSILAGESAAPEGPSTPSTTTTPQQPLVNRIPMNGKVLDSRAIESQLLAPQQSQPPSHSDVQNQANQILQQLQYPPFAAQTVQSIESSLHDQLRRSSSNIPTVSNNLSSNPVASLHTHMLSQIEAAQVPQSQPSTQDDLSLEDKLASAFKQATIQPSLQHHQPVSPQMMPQAVVPLVPQVPQPVPTTQDNNTDLLTMLNNNLRASMTAIIAPQPAQKEPELKITKSQLKNVLVKMVQDDSFVDMVWNQCLLSQPESSN